MNDELKQYLPPEALAALRRAKATKWKSTDLSGDVLMLCQMLAEAERKHAQAWEALEREKVSGIYDEFHDLPDALGQMALYIKERQNRVEELEAEVARLREQMVKVQNAARWLWGFWDGNTIRALPSSQEDVQEAFEQLMQAALESPIVTPSVMNRENDKQPCGHPRACITGAGGRAHTCAWCEEVAAERERMLDLELIADVQHEIWSKWMRWLFKVSQDTNEGFVEIPPVKVERWKRQMDTPYSELSEDEKDSDRHQADLVIAAIRSERGAP